MIQRDPKAGESIERAACPNCQCRELDTRYKLDRYVLKRCRSCQLVFSSHVPDAESLKAYYSTYPAYGPLSVMTIQRYHELLNALEKYRKHNRLLEAGCGYGFFLEEARKRGWEVYGTEYYEEAISQCRSKNIPMLNGLAELRQRGEIPFDAIVSMEVIEHIADFNSEMKAYQQVLRQGGVVYLTTPNFNSLSRYVLGKKWSIINYPEHLTYFTTRTLNQLFRKHGFSKIKILTTGISPGRLLTGFRNLNSGNEKVSFDNTGNNEDQQLRNTIGKKPFLNFLRKVINRVLTIFKAGDTIKAFFTKP